ncbi:RibD family protein [Chromohalobacter sp. TMW 2.2308]|uniref:RibD family protein n=1 Tax=Chromohalobacter moromii TaxID=2860329 RepID=A0A9X2WZA2_9GAMM|nr:MULTISPECIES: RibD family protein [Chromohalobacter]MCK2041713.1 RibD family protein [Chromohalobacter moromii]MCK2044647.1 RibD family protein [Chromohalobacter moromii]MCT8504199.1 RibD family protein [Chromohalobacter moromii]MCT8513861.1 RibD family protein [Chromohalobacter sp. TMW 2.2271]
MSPATLDVALAWQGIREARRQNWDAHAALTLAAGRLRIWRGGAWQADAPVTAEAAALLDSLLPSSATPGRFVIAQLGQSLDGRIATVTGASHYVTGEASRVHLHRLRALVDAVVIGAGTACADDPQLTVRHVTGDNPVRVILDPNGRVPATSGVLQRGDAPTLHITRHPLPRETLGAHVESLVPDGAADLTPSAMLDTLAARGLRRVLIEGGGQTVSRFLADGQLDRLHVVVAPLLIGSGRPAVSLAEIETLDAALRPPCRTFAMGDDTLFDLALRPGHVG